VIILLECTSEDKIWDGADADDLKTLPDTAPYRDVDLAIIDADRVISGHI
jgi:hypothetical protein